MVITFLLNLNFQRNIFLAYILIKQLSFEYEISLVEEIRYVDVILHSSLEMSLSRSMHTTYFYLPYILHYIFTSISACKMLFFLSKNRTINLNFL